LVTTRNGSWVFGVGTDWDNATARVLPSNQTLVHQYLATINDTYWVQRLNAPTSASGTTVTLNDTAPAGDRYDLSIVEVLPAPAAGPTHAFPGARARAALASGAPVTLAQGATTVATVTADALGSYTFAGVADGTYTVTPSKAGVVFGPTSRS